ncbi:hypothetical protein Tco_1215906 [Tanacetum coccineum]
MQPTPSPCVERDSKYHDYEGYFTMYQIELDVLNTLRDYRAETMRRCWKLSVFYTELCHEFFSTFKFDEEMTDEELISKKLIKFRLGGHGGLRNDDYFNANKYSVSISSEDQLRLSRSSTYTIRNPVMMVLQKMITYDLCQRTTGYDKIKRNELWLMSMFEDRNQQRYANVAWVIAKLMKRKRMGTQKRSMIVCGQFVTKLAKTTQLLADDILDGLSAPIDCRSLDATTLRELICHDERLITEDLTTGVSRYMSVFEFMAGHYAVPLDGNYTLQEYDEQQQQQCRDDR